MSYSDIESRANWALMNYVDSDSNVGIKFRAIAISAIIKDTPLDKLEKKLKTAMKMANLNDSDFLAKNLEKLR